MKVEDINWASQPEATHYDPEDGTFVKLEDGVFFELDVAGEYLEFVFEEPEMADRLILRPASERNWDDENMWFDAPEWAVAVICSDAERDYHYVISTEGKPQSKAIGCLELPNGYADMTPPRGWRIIALRPTDNKHQEMSEELSTLLAEQTYDWLEDNKDYWDGLGEGYEFIKARRDKLRNELEVLDVLVEDMYRALYGRSTEEN